MHITCFLVLYRLTDTSIVFICIYYKKKDLKKLNTSYYRIIRIRLS